MVIPLLLGAAFNTWLPDLITIGGDGTFTTYLWKSGAMPILAVFLFCNGRPDKRQVRRHTPCKGRYTYRD